jgi:hypothetical protein
MEKREKKNCSTLLGYANFLFYLHRYNINEMFKYVCIWENELSFELSDCHAERMIKGDANFLSQIGVK